MCLRTSNVRCEVAEETMCRRHWSGGSSDWYLSAWVSNWREEVPSPLLTASALPCLSLSLLTKHLPKAGTVSAKY